MVHYDYLTGLPNRHLLRERIHHTVYMSEKNQAQSAICFIDVDDFKRINDTFGHHIGDMLLVQIVSHIQLHLEKNDDLLRLGGDEFLLILYNIKSTEELMNRLNTLLQDIASIKRVEGCEVSVSLSIGASIAPTQGTRVSKS